VLKEKHPEGAFHEIGDGVPFIVSGPPGIRHLAAHPVKSAHEPLK
jgi:hypothetical protein